MSQPLGKLNPALVAWWLGALHGALGMLGEGAQTLSMPPALVHFVQVADPSTHFQN